MIFDVPVRDGWFIYGVNETFYEHTQFHLIVLSIYNALRAEFVPMPTQGSVYVNEHTHPWILVRALGLQDDDCFCLDISIRHVHTLQTSGHTAEVGIDVYLNTMRGRRNVSANLDSGDDNSDLEMDWVGTQRATVVIDDDSDDMDYVEGASVEGYSDSEAEETKDVEMEVDTAEEDEAVSTEDEDEAADGDTEDEDVAAAADAEDEGGAADTEDKEGAADVKVKEAEMESKEEEKAKVLNKEETGTASRKGMSQVPIDLTLDDDQEAAATSTVSTVAATTAGGSQPFSIDLTQDEETVKKPWVFLDLTGITDSEPESD